jgi:hypothetical protein
MEAEDRMQSPGHVRSNQLIEKTRKCAQEAILSEKEKMGLTA